MLFRLILSLFCGVMALGPAQAQSPAAAPAASRADEVLLDMNAAFKRGDRKRLGALLPQAAGHVLEPWAAYWELRARLDEASTAEVQAFFSRYANTYQEDRLRNDWLLLLGSRRDWTTLEAEHPHYRMRDDRELRCYILLVEFLKAPAGEAARKNTQDALADEVRQNWLSQRDADDGCTLAVDRLYDAQRIAALDIWRKARQMTETNKPRAARLAVQIVAPDAVASLQPIWANPLKFLESHQARPTKLRPELAVLALLRLASSNTDVAARLVNTRWGAHLGAEERHWVWGAIGRQAALRLDDEALNHFDKVAHERDLSDDMLAWKARAALRAGSTPRWEAVDAAIAAMGQAQRQEPVWVYWQARAALARHKPGSAAHQQALERLKSLAGVRGFYEQLAQEELGLPIALPEPPPAPSASEMAQARSNPSLQRALYAIGLGLRSEGVREWNYGTNLVNAQGGAGALGERELLAAAQLACERQVWDRCINTSERTREGFQARQRFPTPFREAVLQRSQQIGLDPAYVYGLIRQESRFVMDARSGVGASGLMQVMPATARWTARHIGLNGFSTSQLAELDTNIAIGTGYLKLVLDNFNGSMPLATAAYNAGPSRARNWRNGPLLEGAIWAENIPFNETRDYVKKVLSNTANYQALLGQTAPSLKALLGTVGPRPSAESPDNTELP